MYYIIEKQHDRIFTNSMANYEYKTYQEGVDASKHVSNRGGWFFGEPSNAVMSRETQDDTFNRYNDLKWQ